MGPRRTLQLSLILMAALAIVLALSGALGQDPAPVDPPALRVGTSSVSW